MPTEPLDQKVRVRLLARRSEWVALAKSADVSYAWIWRFVAGEIPNPGIRTLEKLATALAKSRPRKARPTRTAISGG